MGGGGKGYVGPPLKLKGMLPPPPPLKLWMGVPPCPPPPPPPTLTTPKRFEQHLSQTRTIGDTDSEKLYTFEKISVSCWNRIRDSSISRPVLHPLRGVVGWCDGAG